MMLENQKQMSRRVFLRLAGGAGSAAILAACVPVAPGGPAPASQAGESEVPPAEPVTLEWWWGWTPDLIVDGLEKLAAAFMAAHPEIKMVTGQHSWGEKLLTAYAAGTPPDVHEHWLPLQFAARGQLQALDDRIAASSVINWDVFPEVAWSTGTWEGKHFNVPALAFFAELALVVNPRVFENAGLSSPADVPTTWDEAFEQAKAHTEFDEAGNLAVQWVNPAKNLRHWPAMYGIEDYDEEAHRWLFDDPGWEEVVANIARFYTEFGPEKIDAFYEAYPGWIAIPGSAFASDRLAMVTSGYWLPGELDKNAPDKEFHYTWAPTGGAATGKKVTHWGAHSLMIPRDGKHPDEAWTFIEFVSTIESSEIVFEGMGWISPLKAYWDVVDINRYRGLDFFVNQLAKEPELEVVNSPSPAISVAMGGFQERVVDPVIFGDKDIKTALADFNKLMNEEEVRILEG